MEKNNNPIDINTEIEWYTLLRDVLKNWWVILLGALAAAMLTYVAVSVKYVPQYETSATFAVMSKNATNAYSNLSSANTMAVTFEKILKSNAMNRIIRENLDVKSVDAEIEANVLQGTNLLVLKVKTDSPRKAIDIIRTIMDNYSEVTLYTVGNTVMTVLEEPSIPYAPSNPLNARAMAKKGFQAGLAVCIFIFGLISYLSNTVKQESEIEKKLDAKSFGAISFERKYKTIKSAMKHKKAAVLVDNPLAGFNFVESYRKLATKVDYQMSKEKKKILVVTSIAENEGKSTVAANLAITLAEQSKKVILVDGDIHRPSQFLIFGLNPQEENELGEFLNGTAEATKLLMKTDRQGLYFIGGRNCYAISTEILQTGKLGKLLLSCKNSVDYVIVDTPPAGITGSVQVIAQCADSVLLVAKQNYMPAENINDVLDEFRDSHIDVMGVVLNEVQTLGNTMSSAGGNHYGKYSRYGNYGNYK